MNKPGGPWTAHLAYALLEEAHPLLYREELAAGELQDHHWRIMASWQAERWNASLAALDGRAFLATSCLMPLPTLVLISSYPSPDAATRAFMATGTVAEIYDGKLCSDGAPVGTGVGRQGWNVGFQWACGCCSASS